MNDKERLEEIKKHRNEADNSTDEYEFEKINFYNLHVDWLIEQAGRVQKLEIRLENVMDRHTYLEGDYYDLQKQNKRYREAIEVAIHNMAGDNLGDKYALKILEKALEVEQ